MTLEALWPWMEISLVVVAVGVWFCWVCSYAAEMVIEEEQAVVEEGWMH